MDGLSNRIGKEALKAGDHIYSWRAKRVYAHHGIYVGDDKVIHFNVGRDQEVGTGTFIDRLFASSGPTRSTTPCLVCSSDEATGATTESNGVMSSCLSCFLAGGHLCRFEYAVPALSKVNRGTCSAATADPDEVAVCRAKDSLSTGFGCYDVRNNNCENFAKYCKTGSGRRSGQVVFGISTAAAALFGLEIVLPVCSVNKLLRNSQEEEAEEEK